MTSFLLRRIAQALAVLVVVTMIVFAVLHFLPGSPARALLGIHATPAAIRAFDAANGYNRSLPVQYWLYLDHLVHGNLGYSYHFDQSVGSLLSLDLPKTALLVGLSYVIALAIAIPVGLVQALHRNRALDHTFTTLSFVGYSMPTFWLGLLLVIAFSIKLHLFPSQGPQGATVGAVASDPRALVLPVATLTIVTVAQFSRFMRSAAIDNLLQDYIRTARAKGVPFGQVITKHLLPNSLLPIVTLIGLSLPAVISGAVVVEAIFNLPGMGWLFWTAAESHDYPVLMGFTVVVGAATVIGNLLADVAYALLDPRIRYSAA
ncbi:MAG TPA: ABC transporter permease [Acidimicrobiales bacterium]|nr:ABC transporter permease [Acidimicrobiales bacterium]